MTRILPTSPKPGGVAILTMSPSDISANVYEHVTYSLPRLDIEALPEKFIERLQGALNREQAVHRAEDPESAVTVEMMLKWDGGTTRSPVANLAKPVTDAQLGDLMAMALTRISIVLGKINATTFAEDAAVNADIQAKIKDSILFGLQASMCSRSIERIEMLYLHHKELINILKELNEQYGAHQRYTANQTYVNEPFRTFLICLSQLGLERLPVIIDALNKPGVIKAFYNPKLNNVNPDGILGESEAFIILKFLATEMHPAFNAEQLAEFIRCIDEYLDSCSHRVGVVETYTKVQQFVLRMSNYQNPPLNHFHVRPWFQHFATFDVSYNRDRPIQAAKAALAQPDSRRVPAQPHGAMRATLAGASALSAQHDDETEAAFHQAYYGPAGRTF